MSTTDAKSIAFEKALRKLIAKEIKAAIPAAKKRKRDNGEGGWGSYGDHGYEVGINEAVAIVLGKTIKKELS